MATSHSKPEHPWNVPRRQFLSLASGVLLGIAARSAAGEDLKLAALIDDAPQTHALIPALRMALAARDAVSGLKDYETTLNKTELIGRKTITTRLKVKIRHEPFSVYVKYIEPHAGREAIYVSGKNGNKVVVHDTGLASLVGTLNLDPTSSTAMDENRYPITRIGMLNLVSTIFDNWLALAKSNTAKVSVNHYPNAKIGDQPCSTIEAVLTQPSGTDSFHTTRLYIDTATQLPIRVQQYAFPTRRGQKPVLVEDYLYQNIQANIGLGDADFDAGNPLYGY